MLRRRGASAAEAIVALVLGALVLGAATSSLLRQQRTTVALDHGVQGAQQLHAATALLVAQLELAAPGAWDLRAGEVRDTALQLRATVASGVACDSGADVRIVVPADTITPSGVGSLPRAGDSLWWYRPDSARWVGGRLTAVTGDSGDCPALGITAAARAPLLRFRLASSDAGGARAAAGTPLRVTREMRWSVYRSGDGSWQLGVREWNDAAQALASIQPVAGPLQRVAPDGVRSGFRYFDATGTELSPGADSGARLRIARIRVTAVAPAAPGGTTPAPPLRDSVDIAVRPATGP